MAGTPSSQLPGFDGLRLIAATAVLFSHAFLIAEGTEKHEPLTRLLGPGNILGLYGVFTFFIISGFLLTRSLSLNPNPIQFSANRLLRIFPGFLFCIFTTTFLIGLVFAKKPVVTYLTDPQAYYYVGNSLACVCDWPDPPFSFSDLHTTINGSLWSLSFEILSYLFLIWMWILLRRPLLVALAFSFTALLTVFFPSAYAAIPGIAYTLPYFAGGVAMFVFVSRFGTRGWLALTSLVILCVSAIVGMQHYAFSIFGAYLVVFLGTRYSPLSQFAQRFGDWSYGLYLFGWPVEQVINQLSQPSSGVKLFVYSLPVTMGVAAISWFAVEKPSLVLKKHLPLLALVNPHTSGPLRGEIA